MAHRGYIFRELKSAVLSSALAETVTSCSGQGDLEIELDNMLARSCAEAGLGDVLHPSHASSFYQSFKELGRVARKAGLGLLTSTVGGGGGSSSSSSSSSPHRNSTTLALAKMSRLPLDGRERVFKVRYAREEGLDHGGLFRDCLVRITEDLFSTRCSLFLPPSPLAATPGRGGGEGGGLIYLPNHEYCSPVKLLRVTPLYNFVGNLLGMSLRLKLTLPFLFPPHVWKFFVGQPVKLSDLGAMSPRLFTVVQGVLRGGGSTEPVTWSTALSDAQGNLHEVELCNGGRNRKITPEGSWEERVEWCRLFLQYHLVDAHAPALRAIRWGLYGSVPARAIRLLNWWELEADVCGKPEVDVDTLRAHTVLRGFTRSSPTIRYFWEVLEGWGNEERSAFIRFAWGRSRLPLAEHWPPDLRLIIEALPSSRLAFLPEGHTCFFKLDLPPYNSFAVLKAKLERAIVETNVLTL